MSRRGWGDVQVKARKRHTCRVCGDYVNAGETHIARRGADDGRVATLRFHLECDAESRGWDDWDWETIDPGEISRAEVLRRQGGGR